MEMVKKHASTMFYKTNAWIEKKSKNIWEEVNTPPPPNPHARALEGPTF